MGSPNEAATEPGSGTATVNPTTSSLTTQNSGGGNSSSSESNNLSSVTGITYTKTVPSNANPSGITCSAPILSTTNPDLDTASVNADSQTPNLQSSDHYCLRWINHGSHVLSVFSQLLRDEALVDVTLAAEGQSLRAHKMVLSACSSFFRTIFVSHPERHPIIIFKDTKFDELKTLLEFMYKGEVSVEYGQLGTLLKTAENLRVKGLAEVTTNQTGNPIISPLPPEDLDDDASPIIVEQEQINSVEPSTEDESRTAHRSRDRRSHHTHPYYSRTRSHQHHQTNFHRFSHHESNSANSHGLQCLNHKPYPLDHRERNISTAEELSLRRSRHHHQRQSHIPEQYHHHSRSDVQLEKEERKSRHSQMPTKNLNRPSTAILLDNDRNHRKTSRQPSGEGRTSEIGSPTTGKPNLDSSTTAQDLRKIPPASRSPSPLPTSGPFRTGVISSGNNVQHLNWPAEYTESSESDCDDCSMQSPSEHAHMSNQVVAGQNASERPTHTFISGVTGSNRLDPPQRLPISLKKETEWEVGSSLSIVPGASRSDVQPSRSPSFSESSSEYGRHVDQEHGQDQEADVVEKADIGQECEGPDQSSLEEVGLSETKSGGNSKDAIHSIAETPLVVPSTSRSFPCLHCGVILSSPSRLARHMLGHTVGSTTKDALGSSPGYPSLSGIWQTDSIRNHKRRHLSALHVNTESPVFTMNRPPCSAPITALNSGLFDDQKVGDMFQIKTSRSRHSSETFTAEDLRHRPLIDTISKESSSSVASPGDGTRVSSGPSPLQEPLSVKGSSPSRVNSPVNTAGSEVNFRRERCTNLTVRERLVMLGAASLDNPFGSLPGVAVLASLMGREAHAGTATDLSLGSVIFPRVNSQQDSGTSSTSHAVGSSFPSLNLSYTAAAAALGLTSIGGPSGTSVVSGHTSASCLNSSNTSSQKPVASSSGSSSSSLRQPGLGAGPPALCKFCGKSFLELGALMAHLPFHTGERPFRCDFCGKAFKLRHHMKDHARVHTGERPFPCRLCGKTFSRSTILKAHEKTHLPKSERNFIQPPSPTSMGNGAHIPPS